MLLKIFKKTFREKILTEKNKRKYFYINKSKTKLNWPKFFIVNVKYFRNIKLTQNKKHIRNVSRR